MYVLIQKSNSGNSYVYGPFESVAAADKYATDNFVARSCTWSIVTMFHPIPTGK